MNIASQILLAFTVVTSLAIITFSIHSMIQTRKLYGKGTTPNRSGGTPTSFNWRELLPEPWSITGPLGMTLIGGILGGILGKAGLVIGACLGFAVGVSVVRRLLKATVINDDKVDNNLDKPTPK